MVATQTLWEDAPPPALARHRSARASLAQPGFLGSPTRRPWFPVAFLARLSSDACCRSLDRSDAANWTHCPAPRNANQPHLPYVSRQMNSEATSCDNQSVK
eukprot:730358-Prorocentrum_minimum.AAC.1